MLVVEGAATGSRLRGVQAQKPVAVGFAAQPGRRQRRMGSMLKTASFKGLCRSIDVTHGDSGPFFVRTTVAGGTFSALTTCHATLVLLLLLFLLLRLLLLLLRLLCLPLPCLSRPLPAWVVVFRVSGGGTRHEARAICSSEFLADESIFPGTLS